MYNHYISVNGYDISNNAVTENKNCLMTLQIDFSVTYYCIKTLHNPWFFPVKSIYRKSILVIQ